MITTSDLETWRGDVVAYSVLSLCGVSCLCGLLFFWTVACMLPHVSATGAARLQSRAAPTLSLPEVGSLTLVLRQLGIFARPVPVWHVTDPKCEGNDRLCSSLRTLAAHGGVHLLSLTDAERMARSEHHVVCIVDLDQIESLQLSLPDGMKKEFFDFGVAWSVKHEFAQLYASSMWANIVAHTLVAKPKFDDQMVESVLCRILQLALSHGEAGALQEGSSQGAQGRGDGDWMLKNIGHMKHATKLMPGGEFEVDAGDLAPPDAAMTVSRKHETLILPTELLYECTHAANGDPAPPQSSGSATYSVGA